MTAGFWGKLLLLRLNSHLQSVFIQSQQLLHSPPGSCARSAIPGPIPSHSGGDSQAGAPPCPTSSSSVPSETPFTAGKMSQIGKPKSLSLPGLEVGSCVVWGSSDPGTELWPHPGKSHHLPRGQNCCRAAPVPVSSAASPEHLTPH